MSHSNLEWMNEFKSAPANEGSPLCTYFTFLSRRAVTSLLGHVKVRWLIWSGMYFGIDRRSARLGFDLEMLLHGNEDTRLGARKNVHAST
jgi:hypothetical protein